MKTTKNALWLTQGEADPGVLVQSPDTGEFAPLQDAWITSRYDPGNEGPVVDFGLRMSEALAASDESLREWAEAADIEPLRLEKLVAGVTQPQADLLISIDDLTGGHMLTPPERCWAEGRMESNRRHWERKIGNAYWRDRG